MSAPKLPYPDHETVKQLLTLRGLLAQARWQRAVNLLTFAILIGLAIFVAWLFWPQISVVLSQITTWRNELNGVAP